MCKRVLLILLFIVNLLPVAYGRDWQLENSYQTFAGSPVSLKSYIGHKPVYLKFWASWCLDCRRELPSLQHAYEEYQDQVAMFAVNLNINETDAAIRKLQEKNHLTIPIVMDHNGTIASNVEFVGTPFHVLINRQGEVVYSTYKDDALLQKKLAQLAQTGTVEKVTELPPEVKTSSSESVVAGASLLYFSATWCDWYMKDIHPEMAENCVNAIHVMDTFYQQHPQLPVQAYVTHLWTEPKDLTEYSKKFSIAYPLAIDQNNKQFRRVNGEGYPMMLLLNNGETVARITDFSKPDEVIAALEKGLRAL